MNHVVISVNGNLKNMGYFLLNKCVNGKKTLLQCN